MVLLFKKFLLNCNTYNIKLKWNQKMSLLRKNKVFDIQKVKYYNVKNNNKGKLCCSIFPSKKMLDGKNDNGSS